MNLVLILLLACTLTACGAFSGTDVERLTTSDLGSFYELEATDISGEAVSFERFRGKTVLIVNVASECGLTDQYEGLQKLHERYTERGLVVIGFPSNEFNGQEPGSNLEILEFCQGSYGVSFPMMAKISVKEGEEQAAVYRWLGAASGKLPGWNFAKHLVGPDGAFIAFWPSTTKPEDEEIVAAIESALR